MRAKVEEDEDGDKLKSKGNEYGICEPKIHAECSENKESSVK